MESRNIHVRLASVDDLPALFELDYLVSFEFFKPLYEKGYAHLSIGRDAEKWLMEEFRFDLEWFSQIVREQHDNRLYAAFDNSNGKSCGLVIIKKVRQKEAELLLLMVHPHYRGQGIGKKLVMTAIKGFDALERCHVFPLRFCNRATQRFYEKIGFVNLGIGPKNRYNLYGIPYADMYLHFCYFITEECP